MLQNNSGQQYVIQIISQANPIKVKLPIVPTQLQHSDGHVQVLTIDDCNFTSTKDSTALNHITPSSDFIQIMFNNGSGCFDQNGRQSKLLQILAPVTQIISYSAGKYDISRQSWRLAGGTDPFLWTFGHDLQIGFTNIYDSPIDFSATGLNTSYTLIIQILIQ